ncbi:MAG: 4Fe-4S double cluster binding domain-containing protein [Candidatus Hodarchaeota archaeon]
MTQNTIIEKIHKTLDDNGYKGKIVSAKHIPDLQNDIKKHRDNNLLAPEFYNEFKSYLEFEPNVDLPKINSLFILAVPQPQYEAVFNWTGKKVSLLIPPTYLYGLKIINYTKEFLNEILNQQGYRVEYGFIPSKTLAVRSGLAEYGRNNITYVPGMGSFHRLSAFYSDFPIEKDNWQELKLMDLCKECSACVRKCPTGAIPTNRVLLHAERCLTFHNEHPVEIPFPEWIDPSWHNCLVGCLFCQKVCPANKKVINWTEPGPEFTEEETNQILSGTLLDKLPMETKEKIEKFDLVNYYEILPRNLAVFL